MSESLKTLTESYRPNQLGVDIVRATRTVELSGIVSAGKDTLSKELLRSATYHRIVTHTTRAPRENNGVMEQDGVEYHFVTHEQMIDMIHKKQLLEVNLFGEHMYGTSLEEFTSASNMGKIALGDIDINGVRNLRSIAGDSLTAVLVVPPDYDTWQQRYRGRYSSQELFDQDWAKRRNITISELEAALETPYYHFVINDDLARATTVIDKLAHKELDVQNSGDEAARQVARQLLDAIKAA